MPGIEGGLAAAPNPEPPDSVVVRFSAAPDFKELRRLIAGSFPRDAPTLVDLARDGSFAVVAGTDPMPAAMVRTLLSLRGVLWLEPDCGSYARPLVADPDGDCRMPVRRASASAIARPELEHQSAFHAIAAPIDLPPRMPRRATTVAILDGELRWDHPYLAAHLAWNAAEQSVDSDPKRDDDGNYYCNDVLGWDFVDWDADVRHEPNPSGGGAHATWVAGVVTAMSQRANVDMRILPLRANRGRPSSARVARAIRYAASRRVDVLIIPCDWPQDSQIVREALEVLKSAGGVVVSAAGNRVTDLAMTQDSPAYHTAFNDGLIAVQPHQFCTASFFSGLSLLSAVIPVKTVQLDNANGVTTFGESSAAAAIVGAAAAVVHSRESDGQSAPHPRWIKAWLTERAQPPQCMTCPLWRAEQRLINLDAIR